MKQDTKGIKDKITKLESERLQLKHKEKRILPYFLFVPLASFLSMLVMKQLGPVIIFTLFVSLIAWILYYNSISSPFNVLKTKLRSALLQSFMKTYHPLIKYTFHEGKRDVKDIVKGSKLITASAFKEEDVIEGKMNQTHFYLSEIHLKKKANKSEYTVFKGMLFRLKIPGKNYPKSQIQSKPGLIKKMFGGFLKNEEYDFFYESGNPTKFENEIGALFPFFKYLMQKNKDVRIRIEGDELILMLESDIKFLDDPKPTLGSSFDNQEYYNKMAQHLNAFLFIIESISTGADALQLEEKLKIKLEYYTNRK